MSTDESNMQANSLAEMSPRAHPRSLWETAGRPGRVIGRAEALAFGERLLGFVREQSLGVFVEHSSRAVTTVRADRIDKWQVGDELGVWFSSQFGSGWPVYMSTNQMDDASIKRVVEQAVAMLPPKGTPPRENPDDPKYFTVNKREAMPVSLWHDSTARAIETPDTSIATALSASLRGTDLDGAATLAVSARSLLYLYQPGLTAWCQETDSEVTCSVRTRDGKTSAWAGDANRKVDALQPASVVKSAIQLAEQGRNPVAIEPGRRTAILGPIAVAQLVRFMAEAFDGSVAKMGDSPLGETIAPGEFRTRIGQRVLDARLRMVSDPADPLGGFPPFFEKGTRGMGNVVGLPYPSIPWIEKGVLQHLAWGILSPGRQWCELPYSVRLEAMPGVTTTSIEEMIAACEEGIYVNRFGSIDELDQKSGTLTGVTRDGCFFVKNGKINKPVKNFRFIESPFHIFNRLRMIGPSARVPLGMDDPTQAEKWSRMDWPPQGRWTRWPRVPIIVPPMMVQDFNFSALFDAV